jgi:Family of unknown function (DUF6130)
VDDLPWWWADASDNNTVDIAGLRPGPHKVKIELVDANHNVIAGQAVTLRFTVPENASGSLSLDKILSGSENQQLAKFP